MATVMPPGSVLDSCPKGGSSCPVVRNHDELMCMAHGTFHTPRRAYDRAIDSVDPQAVGKRSRLRTASHVPMPWTEEEKRAWEEWREGDPGPDEDEDERQPVTTTQENRPMAEPAALPEGKVLDIEKVGRLALESLRTIRGRLAGLDEQRQALLADAQKTANLVKACGLEVPDELITALSLRRPHRSLGGGDGAFACEACPAKFRTIDKLRRHSEFHDDGAVGVRMCPDRLAAVRTHGLGSHRRLAHGFRKANAPVRAEEPV